MNLFKEDYSQLFEQYQQLQENNHKKIESGIHDYNLINALLKKTDEVNLHSNFIYSMINPKGLHYCQDAFLKLFLETIEKENIIDTTKAHVFKEKGKIDLLIKDDKNFIIIENKLRAEDQQYQISRYIQYVVDRYMEEDIEEVGERIHIVYLSEYKAVPDKNKESIKGFKEIDESSTELIWENNDIFLNNKQLRLLDDTKISFKRIKHSESLSIWTEKAKEWLVDNKPNSTLNYAFDEYQQILLRLRKNKWRKLMDLDDYILSLEHESDEKKMYQFMLDAEKKRSSYQGKKLFQIVNEKLKSYNNIDDDNVKKFSETNCIKWFAKKGNREQWNNVVLEFYNADEKYILALGTKYIYCGKKTDNLFEKNNRLEGIDTSSNIFSIIEAIEKRLKKFKM